MNDQLEDFQCSLREAILKAERLKVASWPDFPVIMPLRVAITILAAMAPLEQAIGKAIDAIAQSELKEGEILWRGGDECVSGD